jgi:ABC-2 type transport system ATP-binding protein
MEAHEANMNDVIIETHGLTRQFGEHVAVSQLDLQVRRGEVFGFLGPNGAGKTTTIRLLNGILTPSAGSARVAGFDPTTQGSEVRRRAGVLTESPALYEQLSARENLLIFGELYGAPPAELPARVDAVLELLGLRDRAADKAGTYSKGMKQRLVIARALVHQPELLYLDEPTAGLDPAASRQVMDLIEALSHQEGRTVFLCTHNLFEAQRLCDRVGVINQGRLLAVGTPAELAKKLWRGTWVQVEIGSPPSAGLLSRLQGEGGILEVKAEGALLDILLDDKTRTPALVSALAAAGAAIFRVAPREHSLEEIYFELQENGEAKP